MIELEGGEVFMLDILIFVVNGVVGHSLDATDCYDL